MKAPTLRDDPAWRAMFARLDAKDKAARSAEAHRWRGLSHRQKWEEMARAARRWRPATGPRVVDRLVHHIADQLIAGDPPSGARG
jgi:hypothetical protein